MQLDRKMLYLNALFLTALGIGFAIRGGALPAAPTGKPWEAGASEILLGMTLGGVGVALCFLRRVTHTADYKRLTLGWLLINIYVPALAALFLQGSPGQINPRLERTALPWVAGSVHLALVLCCCATVVWRQGAEFRRVSQLLLRGEAAFALLAGYGAAAAVRAASLPWDPGTVIRLLGIELLGFAAALAILGNPAHGDDRRRLLLGLGAGNALTAVLTLAELRVWGFDALWAWGLVLAQVALTAGSVWAGLRRERAGHRPTSRALASRLTWSHLLAALTAAGLVMAAPALSLPSWAALLLALFLALVVSAAFAGEIQRLLMNPDGFAAVGGGFAVPGPELDEAARQTWLRQVSEAAAQEERNRLARDLHDSIKQQLFSINVGTAAAQERWERNPEGARKALADVRRSAREAMVEMQAMLHQLRPEALGAAGLVEALREQCEALGYRTGAGVALEIGAPLPDDRLPPGAQETLFRIAQEALANVARHARARQVRVRLGVQGESVGLEVTDDGQGFDPAQAATGMGLRNLRERTASLQGHLEVTSAPGEGTRIAVEVPFSPLPAPAEIRLVKGIAKERRSWLGNVLVIALNLALMDPLYKGILVALALCQEIGSAQTVRSLLHEAPGAAPWDVARLRFYSLRNRVLFLLAAAYGSLQALLAVGKWGWALPLTLCLALAAWELARFHRWSRAVSWPSWVWPSGWEGSSRSVLFLAGIALALAIPLGVGALRLFLWLEPQHAGLLALSAVTFLYVVCRRPRPEGDPV